MSLTIRITADNCVRSVDERPGVIGAGEDSEGFTLTIDSKWEPSAAATAVHAAAEAMGASGTVGEVQAHEGPGFPPHIERLLTDDAMAAAEGRHELRALVGIAASIVPDAMAFGHATWQWERVIAAATFAIEVRDAAIRAAGALPDGG